MQNPTASSSSPSMSTDKVCIDDDKLALLQFATPFRLVPFVETPCAKAALIVSPSQQLGAQEIVSKQARLHDTDKDAMSSTLLRDRQSHDPPTPLSQKPPTIEAQLDTKTLRGDAAAANWGSHLLIYVGTDTSHVTLEARES